MYLLGLDIGGTKCAAVLGEKADEELRILKKQSCPTDLSIPPMEMLERLCGMAEAVCGGRKPAAAGVSCGGPLYSGRGVILGPPNLPGWDDVPVCAFLRKRLGIPAYLQNDANASALAEWKYGAGRGCRHMVFLTFGTGLGAGLILNGKLYAGAGDMAGEVGHVRLAEDGPVGFGKVGSFEGFCSGGGLGKLGEAMAKEAIAGGVRPGFYEEGRPVTAKDLASAARDGDETAIEVYKVCGRQLGRGLALLIDILAPEKIVIGSVFARSGELLIPEMEKAIAAEALPESAKACQIVPAALSENLGDYAALSTADV